MSATVSKTEPQAARNREIWTENSVGDQTGKVVVITGANSGTGLECAKVFAAHGAKVVLACRSREKAEGAVREILAEVSNADVTLVDLNLGSLRSVRECAQELHEKYNAIDILINNAGVMVPPYQLTEDGFELQFGTNHLGHFAFTGLILDLLTKNPGSRIVNVSSGAHRWGSINFDDLECKQKYVPTRAYGQSKIANLMFTYELQRRLSAAGSKTIAVAAHPGWSRTELQKHANKRTLPRTLMKAFLFLSQDARHGAYPYLRAATDPNVHGGQYYGPDKFKELKGNPVLVSSNERSHDEKVQKELWRVSEQLTNVVYPI